MTRFFSEALGKHDRASFASGNARIDGYFRTAVSQDVKRSYAACYVLIERESDWLAGFYTLSASQIPLTDIPPDMARKLPRYPAVPAVRIGWLGRDLEFRGQEIGGLLLHDAIARVTASPIGAYALFADAIDDAAAAFYRRYQFTSLSSRPGSLFLPLSAEIAAGSRSPHTWTAFCDFGSRSGSSLCCVPCSSRKRTMAARMTQAADTLLASASAWIRACASSGRITEVRTDFLLTGMAAPR